MAEEKLIKKTQLLQNFFPEASTIPVQLTVTVCPFFGTTPFPTLLSSGLLLGMGPLLQGIFFFFAQSLTVTRRSPTPLSLSGGLATLGLLPGSLASKEGAVSRRPRHKSRKGEGSKLASREVRGTLINKISAHGGWPWPCPEHPGE